MPTSVLELKKKTKKKYKISQPVTLCACESSQTAKIHVSSLFS